MALTKVQIDGVEFSDSTDLNVDNGTLVVDATNNRVGVGTSSPEQLLHVRDDGTDPAYLRLDATGDNTINKELGGIEQFNRDTTGASPTVVGRVQFRAASDAAGAGGQIYFQTHDNSGSEQAEPTTRMVIDEDGNVGIGTTSPTDPLTVFGDTSGTMCTIQGSNTTDGYGLFVRAGGTDSGRYVATFQDAASNTRLHILSNGNVGIGTNFSDTTIADKTGLLNIHTTDTGTHNGMTLFWDHNNQTTAIEQRIQFALGDDASDDNYQNAGYIAIGKEDTWQGNGQRSAYLAFGTSNAATQSEKARIDSSGRLLVGTSSTASTTLLQVEGKSNDGTAHAGIFLRRGSAPGTNDALGYVLFGDNNSNAPIEIGGFRDGGTWTAGSSMPTRLVFSTTADGASSPTERMRITNAGAVRFSTDTDTPGFGDTTTGGCIRAGGDLFVSASGAAPAYFNRNSSTGTIVSLRYNGAERGKITTDGTVVAYNTSSDYRLKENVVPLTGAADRIKQLKPSQFNFISDPSKTVDGFLAHETQAVVPECVTGEKDAVDDEGNPVYQGIDQSKLVPLLTAALQEALAEIESLKARVTALEP